MRAVPMVRVCEVGCDFLAVVLVIAGLILAR